MPDYDINEAFKQAEDELIVSMIRNFKHHRADETKEGFNWEQWQVKQLESLEVYRNVNKKKFSKKFSSINAKLEEYIQQMRADGNSDQEIQILEAIKKGYKTKNYMKSGVVTDFIKMNDRKMNALIKATTNDLSRAEHAMLRMANDQYRKVIFKTQVYSASGAGTYEKAVDMATKDFLRAGINCVEYKNGARHTMQDYSSMVLTTTGKRAYLTGEGEMRKSWGESLVIMNKRGLGKSHSGSLVCPMCAQWAGKVLVDDVWSGGEPDGKHPLMSAAMAEGLYHPRCKDGHTTYFEDISDAEEEPMTQEERSETVSNYNAEQKRKHAQKQAEKLNRMSKYSLDESNKKIYKKRAEKWERIAENTIDNSSESDIMNVRSDEVALELQRYGRNKNTQVNKTYIEGGEYRRKFDKATDDKAVNRVLYDKAKGSLKHRSGTALEDMHWINSKTAEVILSVTDSTIERTIIYTDKIKKTINDNKSIITIHTHPSSMPPSIDDFNSCYKNGYKLGFVACHDGKIFKYSSRQEVSKTLYSLYIDDFLSKGFDESESQFKALEKIMENHAIEFMEVT